MQEHLKQAEVVWLSGQGLKAGEIVFEALPVAVRPEWAMGILRCVASRTGIETSATRNLSRVASNSANWKKAHAAFSKLRDETLKLDKIESHQTNEQQIRHRQLLISECVSKVIYNATDPPDPFDEDSGWWIVACLRDLVDFIGEREFADSAWAAVCKVR